MSRFQRRTLLKAASVMSAASVVSVPTRGAAAGKQRVLKRDPLGLIEVPEGFSVRVIERSGDAMSDGFRVPARPDAMGCFILPSGDIALMRNHENMRGQSAFGPQQPGQPLPPEAYDPECFGGVSRVVFDGRTMQRKSSNLVLTGTINNCAGGVSPWGWLTCEEWESDRDHGYVFLCDHAANKVQPPRVIKGYGRFRHEAACIDPRTRIAYLTEDQTDAAFYRFVPRNLDKPFEGQLQALAIDSMPRFDTGESMPQDQDVALKVNWVDINDANPSSDSIRHDAHDKGAAFVRRGEGMWFDGDGVYFCATIGGPAQLGQIFRLDVSREPNTLSLVAESPGSDVLNMPDNITVAPSGHVYVTEDGSGVDRIQRIASDGQPIPFARNLMSDSEFTGVCFAPNGKTMFVNSQIDGVTLAIDGPFEQDAASDADYDRSIRTNAHPTGSQTGLIAGGGLAALALAAFVYRRRNNR